MKNKNTQAICFCGKHIDDGNIEYSNYENEIGEAYYEGIAICKCNKEIEWSSWGECESLEEAKEDLQSMINDH